MGTNKGLVNLNISNNQLKYYQISPTTENTQKYAIDFASILKDKNGLIWIGTQGKGLAQFNPSTEINFTVEQTGHVELVVYNVAGQEVAKMIDGTVAAGSHKVRFDASHLPTGVYFYRLTTDNKVAVKKMALMK